MLLKASFEAIDEVDRAKRLPIPAVARAVGLNVSGAQYRCWRTHEHSNGDAQRSGYFSDRFNTAKCYGCGWWGDTIQLVRDVKGFGFREALDFLRELPDEPVQLAYQGDAEGDDSQSYPSETRQQIYAALLRGPWSSAPLNHDSARYLHKRFRFHIGKQASVTGYRSLASAAIRLYGVRFLDDTYAAFNSLKTQFGLDELKSSGVVSIGGRFLFREHRLLFPVLDGDKIVGIEARTLNSQDQGDVRRWQRPRGPLVVPFNSNSLSALRPGEEVRVFEGPIDAISLEVASLDHKTKQPTKRAVAVYGASNFRLPWARQLAQFHVVLAPDNDKGGETFVQRGTDLLSRAGCTAVDVEAIPQSFKDFNEYLCSEWVPSDE